MITHKKPLPKAFFGLVTVKDLKKVTADFEAQIAAVNNTITTLQDSFKKNDLLARVQKLETQLAKK